MTLGILSIACGFNIYTCGISPLIGLILSAVALSGCRKGTQGGREMAITGLVLNILSILIFIFIIIPSFWWFFLRSQEPYDFEYEEPTEYYDKYEWKE